MSKPSLILKSLVSASLLCCALIGAPTAHANALSDAWACAKDATVAQYSVTIKAAKASQVLGASPQCLAMALSPDAPLLTLSGAMFAINAADPQLLPANASCQPALKSAAAMPIGLVLDALVPDIVPDVMLASVQQDAANALWSFLSSTPPFMAITQRAECGCTFLEAGLSVETVKDMLRTIAKAGKSCDQFLENVPGYTVIKSTVAAGAAELNSALEGVLTDQTQHKPPQEYYLYDFGGHPRSHPLLSHAAQWVLDPSHQSASQPGAAIYVDRYLQASAGATAMSQRRAACITYFDEHKMSASNAAKVCDGFIAQFQADVVVQGQRMKALHEVFSTLPTSLNALAAAAKSQCTTQYAGTSVVDPNGEFYCKADVDKIIGNLPLQNPYTYATDTWGLPIDPQEVQQMLAKTVERRVLIDQNEALLTGAYRMAYDSLLAQGLDTSAAQKVTLATVKAQLALHQQHHTSLGAALKKKADTLAYTQLVTAFMQDVGSQRLAQCPSVMKESCQLELWKAWQICQVKLSAVVISGEFPNTSETNQLNAVRASCEQRYTALVGRINDWTTNAITDWVYTANLCTQSVAASDKTVCEQENLGRVLSCAGGYPYVNAQSWVDGLVRQQPAPSSDCSLLKDQFQKKWTADESQLSSLSSARTQALALCNSLTAGSNNQTDCVTRVQAAHDKCQTHIQTAYSLLVPKSTVGTGAHADAMVSFTSTASRCIARVKDQAQYVVDRAAAPELAVTQYGAQCPPNDRTGNWGTLCRTALAQAVESCMATSPTPTRALEGGSTRLSVGSLSIGFNSAVATPSLGLMLSQPVGAFDFQLPGSIELTLRSPDEIVQDCSSGIQAALAQSRSQYVQAHGYTLPSSSADVVRYLGNRGCTVSITSTTRANVFICPTTTGMDACTVLKNAAAPLLGSCLSSGR